MNPYRSSPFNCACEVNAQTRKLKSDCRQVNLGMLVGVLEDIKTSHMIQPWLSVEE